MAEEEIQSEGLTQHPYRGRHLTTIDDRIWQHNTWDEIPWTEEQQSHVDQTISLQKSTNPGLSPVLLETHLQQSFSKWDTFYTNHSRWFFRDRNWLQAEFPQVFDLLRPQILELGCGAGNTLFPLLRARLAQAKVLDLPAGHIYACDFSSKAIDLVKTFREYNPSHASAFVYDLTCSELPLPAESLDCILAVFVLSAIDPLQLAAVFKRLHQMLKPGGLLLFRDYGRGDLAQLRLKPQRILNAEQEFYQRGDGTNVHFFTKEEVESLAQSTGFVINQLITDRRVIVNRLRKLTMFRVWQQGVFQK